ncbi:unnamed protein product [Boreogadus saida]
MLKLNKDHWFAFKCTALTDEHNQVPFKKKTEKKGQQGDASFRRLRREADSARGIQPITEPHLGLKGSGWRGRTRHGTAEDSPHLLG